MQACLYLYADLAEQEMCQDSLVSTYSLHTVLGQLHIVPDLPATQHAALKLSLFACHAFMTLSCHVQALDLQQHDFKLSQETTATAAANGRAALLKARRSLMGTSGICRSCRHGLLAIYLVLHNIYSRPKPCFRSHVLPF